ncbi:putative solute carrier family 22 member 31 [Numida meleagris]|uniref:putative solute carrier family 22 member 31 n=1 Tax=Numida meleagris TaxID=8996 RepID=UPI000B3DA80B|nr:putative solute carrier family 22 member 31 [Numida meleagris]
MACDRFGRRPTFLVSLGLAVPLGLGVALAIDFVMVLVARLLFGAALAGAFLSLYVARLELCDPPHRLEVTMIAGFSWLAGELLLPGLAVLCREWRVLQGAVTAVLALLAACWWFIGSGIRHCFTRNLAPHLPRFLPAYFALRGPEAAACLFLCVTVERCGRRAVLLLCTVLTGTASLLLLALTQYLLELIVLMLSVLGVTASHAVTMLSIFFASEVLPTVVRGAGLGLVVGANLVGSAAAPIAAVASSRGFFLHHLVFASFAILAVLSIMLLPESQGRRLPHSLQEGESQRRPPLFRRPPREDHLPLLAPRGIPHDYSRIVPSAQRALGPGRGPAGPPPET